MMDIAFLFPGQGAQTPGFLSRLPDHPVVSQTLEEASECLGTDARDLDSEESLASTVGVQLSGLISGVAVARALSTLGVVPDAVAGLSSGAYGAAVTCGALTLKQALPLIKQRATLMQAAYPHGYGLVALVGLVLSQVLRIVAEINGPTRPLYVANINTPSQIVLAGNDDALDAAIHAAQQAGARHAQRMAVSVPSHCALLDSVATALKVSIGEMEILKPATPYISNVKARAVFDAEGIRDDLTNNVAHTVRWHDAMTLLFERGVRNFFEMPPGTTLTGMVRETFDPVQARSLSDTPLDTVTYLASRIRSA